jgi:hypothetical protein
MTRQPRAARHRLEEIGSLRDLDRDTELRTGHGKANPRPGSVRLPLTQSSRAATGVEDVIDGEPDD